MAGWNYDSFDDMRPMTLQIRIVAIHRNAAATVVPAAIATGTILAGAAVIVGAEAPRSLTRPI
ncbi:hypothetical protein [Bosea sp. ASV33]|uniref:hypothetical protein n=1 Tax=Bosea sp. ASV33 TaxID=2795106 RepID=UPI0018EA3AEC|nr:hypothetical protein [Bosea sp. ASV33]